MFVRKAEGFPAFVVALIREPSYNEEFNFSDVCDQVKPMIIFPQQPEWTLGEPVDAKGVYLKSKDNKPAVYVFQCV